MIYQYQGDLENHKEKYLIMKNDIYNRNKIILIEIDTKVKEFTAKKVDFVEDMESWKKTEQFTFASSLLNSFLSKL